MVVLQDSSCDAAETHSPVTASASVRSTSVSTASSVLCRLVSWFWMSPSASMTFVRLGPFGACVDMRGMTKPAALRRSEISDQGSATSVKILLVSDNAVFRVEAQPVTVLGRAASAGSLGVTGENAATPATRAPAATSATALAGLGRRDGRARRRRDIVLLGVRVRAGPGSRPGSRRLERDASEGRANGGAGVRETPRAPRPRRGAVRGSRRPARRARVEQQLPGHERPEHDRPLVRVHARMEASGLLAARLAGARQRLAVARHGVRRGAPGRRAQEACDRLDEVAAVAEERLAIHDRGAGRGPRALPPPSRAVRGIHPPARSPHPDASAAGGRACTSGTRTGSR